MGGPSTEKAPRRADTAVAIADVLLGYVDKVALDAMRELAEAGTLLHSAGFMSGGVCVNLQDALASLARHQDWNKALAAKLVELGVSREEITAIEDAAH